MHAAAAEEGRLLVLLEAAGLMPDRIPRLLINVLAGVPETAPEREPEREAEKEAAPTGLDAVPLWRI